MTKKKQNHPSSSDELEKAQAELREAQAGLALMTETAKRAMADLQNYKRRTEEERGDLQIYANLKLLGAIFPTIDNLARAIENAPKDLEGNEWLKGVQAIEKNLLTALTALGLESISETGVLADPHRHEILMEGEGPKGQVIQIF